MTVAGPLDIRFDERGLVPAIVQDASTAEVLMLGWMSRESLELTLARGTTWFFSRSRQELWNKGATSGNFQHVVEVLYDCDGDALVVKVRPNGPACHTGERSCFYRSVAGTSGALGATGAAGTSEPSGASSASSQAQR